MFFKCNIQLNAEKHRARRVVLKCGFAAMLLSYSGATAFAQTASSGAMNSNSLSPASALQAVSLPVQKEAYQRANENLTNQTMYLQSQISTLEKDSEDLSNNNLSDDQFKQDTQGFCDANTDKIQCLKDYTETERRALERIRSPLNSNQTAVFSLESTAPTTAVSAKTINGTAADPLKPSVPTFEDLTPVYASANATQSLADKRKAVAQWAQSFSDSPQNGPQPSDFNITKSVDLDPSDPSKGKADVLVIDPKTGQPEYDHAKFNEAKLAWSSHSSTGIYQDEGVVNGQTFGQRVMTDASAKNFGNAPDIRSPANLENALDAGVITTPATPLNAKLNYMVGRNYIVGKYSDKGDNGSALATGRSVASIPGSPSSSADPILDKALTDAQNNVQPSLDLNKINANKTDSLYMSPTNIDSSVNLDLKITATVDKFGDDADTDK